MPKKATKRKAAKRVTKKTTNAKEPRGTKPGVNRKALKDGHGREAEYWVASAWVDGGQRIRRFAVNKYGDKEARRLATEQKREWEESKVPTVTKTSIPRKNNWLMWVPAHHSPTGKQVKRYYTSKKKAREAMDEFLG